MDTQQKIRLYNLASTSDPDIFRYVNQNGDWEYYYVKSKDLFVPATSKVIRAGFPKGEFFNQWLLSKTKDEAKEILETTGERGSRIHEAIRLLLQGERLTLDTLIHNQITGKPEKITMDEWECLLAFERWHQTYQPETIASEKTIVNLGKEKSAGTIDYIGRFIYNKVEVKALLDWKTGSGIYDDYKLQTANYYVANNDPSVTHTGILRLGTRHKCGYEFVLWDKTETKNHYKQFQRAYGTYEFLTPPFKKDDTEIPFEIQLQSYSPSPTQGEAKSKRTKKAVK